MQYRGFLFGLSACSVGAAFFACGGGDSGASSGDGGVEGGGDVAVDGNADGFEPPDDASRVNCTLDNGGDPVALCTQKFVLSALRRAVLTRDGVQTAWDSASGQTSGAHDFHDDAAYASAAANYGTASSRYGDTEITPLLDADLVALVPILKSELDTTPDEYSGELYTHLRDAAVGLRYVSRNDDANTIDALADDYGRNIYRHFITMGPQVDGGPQPDGGPAPVSDGVLVANKGSLDYTPADVATGSLALLDLAARYPTDPEANRWVDAAHSSIEHIVSRAREPSTKRYYQLLVPSGAPGHDDISPRAQAPADLLTTDAAATVALALLRAQDLVDHNGAALVRIAGYPLVDYANQAIAAANASPSLWDAQGGGYMEASSQSRGVVYSNKPTRANALMFAAIHRANVQSGTPQRDQLKPLRDLMTLRQPENASLLSVTPGQNAYFLEASRDFGVALLDAGFPGDTQSYVSAATFAACEGFNEQLVGVP